LAMFFFFLYCPPGIHTLSLPDALPISERRVVDVRAEPRTHDELRARRERPASDGRRHGGAVAERVPGGVADLRRRRRRAQWRGVDRKSTRLNSSHQIISYAVFCLKKKT